MEKSSSRDNNRSRSVVKTLLDRLKTIFSVSIIWYKSTPNLSNFRLWINRALPISWPSSLLHEEWGYWRSLFNAEIVKMKNLFLCNICTRLVCSNQLLDVHSVWSFHPPKKVTTVPKLRQNICLPLYGPIVHIKYEVKFK